MDYLSYSNVEKKSVDQKKLIKYLNMFAEDLLKKEIAAKEKISAKQENIQQLLYKEKELDNNIDETQNLFSPSSAKLESKKQQYIEEIEKEKEELSLLKKEYEEIRLDYNKIREIYEYLVYHIHLEDKENTNTNIKDDKVKMNISNEELGLWLLETQEFERKRIARDLHDSTVQDLTSIVHKAELCSKLVTIDTIRTKLELQTLTESVRAIINDIRSIIYDLRPMSIDDLGLVATIQKFIDEVKINKNIDIKFDKEGKEANLLSVVNLTLFRIVQEACNNTIKHADATKIIIKLIYQDTKIELLIQDNGCGFEKEIEYDNLENQVSNFGLSIIKERVYLLKGEVTINSKIGKGTEVKVEIPINKQMEGKYDTN